MLETVWRKGNSLKLLVGMQTDTTTLEESMEIPKKTRNKTTTGPRKPTTEHIPRGNHTLVFNAALFTIARIWKEPRCPSADEWVRKLWCVGAKSLQSCPSLCKTMDGSLPGSSVHGIFQARMLEWVAIPSSRGSS